MNRPQSSDDAQQNMWSSLLDNVASGKRLPEKNVLVFGGSAEMQKDFLATLDSDKVKKTQERYRKKPQIANEFALGYTYQDVLDTDQEDILARLSIYTLQQPSISFVPLVKPLLSPQAIPETLLVILLDWAEPWTWVRQIRNWIRLLHSVLSSLDEEAKIRMQEVMKDWEQRRRGAFDGSGASGANNDVNVTIPLGAGEWDEALGLPLCVVCHNSDKIDMLEREYGWREEEFDYVLQFLRTILLKHGASLIYTSDSAPNSLPLLIQCSLGIHSLLNRQSLRHNVIDRDKIIIPPNWDSWGKIRILREGFDVEGMSESWSLEIQPSTNDSRTSVPNLEESGSKSKSTVLLYEDTIKDPKGESSFAPVPSTTNGLELEALDAQEFLASQAEAMERLKVEEEQAQDARSKDASGMPSHGRQAHMVGNPDERSQVNEHIGPVQFNMGGIQVDAEDMLKRLREREREETPDRETAPAAAAAAAATPDGKPQQNEALANFFAGLIKRGGANSPKPQAK